MFNRQLSSNDGKLAPIDLNRLIDVQLRMSGGHCLPVAYDKPKSTYGYYFHELAQIIICAIAPVRFVLICRMHDTSVLSSVALRALDTSRSSP